MYEVVVVRYGEIFLKSEFVKRQFENRLVENIRRSLAESGLGGEIIRRRHRIIIQTPDVERVADSLCKIFGVVSTSPAIETCADVAEIATEGLNLARSVLSDGDRFAVRAKRSGQHSFSSKEVEKSVADGILQDMDVSVDLTNPDKTIFVEVSDEIAFIFDRKNVGVGGLPYRTQGKVVSLISTGIDSPVAAWMMMRRGCEVVGLHLGEGGRIEEIMDVLEGFTAHPIRLYKVPYERILARISRNAGKNTCIICKRTMLRVAERIARIENAHGVVTGDNLGQVASQTLENLEVLSEVTSPIYRPLIGLDKEEIVRKAREIGTYKLAEKKRCAFVPKKPATRAHLEEIKKSEAEMGIEALVDELKLECLKR